MITDFPYFQNFENSEDTVQFTISGTGTNQWKIGSAVNYSVPSEDDENPTTGNALYVSNDNGVSNAYTVSSTSISYAVLQVQFGGDLEYRLSFDYRVEGEGTSTRWDYLAVYMLDTNQSLSVIPASTINSSTSSNYRLMLDNKKGTTWQHYAGAITGVANTTKKIVFVWRNDGSQGDQPPAAVDNISIVASECPLPTNLAVSDVEENQVTLSWTENGDANQWTLYYKKISDNDYTEQTMATNPYDLTGLDASSVYTAYMVANCSGEDTSLVSNNIVFSTLCAAITIDEENTSFFDNFEGLDSLNCWTPLTTLTYSGTNWPNIYAASGYAYSGTNSLALSRTASSSYDLVSTMVASPQFTNDINTLRVRFWSRFADLDDKLVVGYMTDLTDSTTFVAMDTITPTVYTYTRNEFMFNNAESTENAYIIFKYLPGNTYNYGLYIDNVIVDLIPSCIRPTDLVVTDISSDEVTISWTANNNETEWMVYTTNTENGSFDEGTVGNRHILHNNRFSS